jgi:pyridoxamine 5'-phosphate oxidase
LSDINNEKGFSASNPFEIFRSWLKDASESELNDPDAIALATVDKEGLPNVRMVLLRYVENDGFVFFTNYGSAKGKELILSGKVAFACHWKTLRRQIRVRGLVSKDEGALSESYFNARPLDSRIGAWASKQSSILENKEILLSKINEFRLKFGENPKKPSFWGGFRIKPLEIEFWSDGKYRLHDRFLWKRDNISADWKVNRLSP